MRAIKTLQTLILAGAITFLSGCNDSTDILWKIGRDDQSAEEFALAPDDFDRFLEKDFGFEDRSFIIGVSRDSVDWPYVLPGPSDRWGGTSGTAGWRSHYLNVLFGIERSAKGPFTLVLDVKDYNPGQPPLVRITVNGKQWKYQLPAGNDTI